MNWISVKDKLPVDGQKVLCLDATGIARQYEPHIADFYLSNGWISCQDYNKRLTIHYWTSLEDLKMPEFKSRLV